MAGRRVLGGAVVRSRLRKIARNVNDAVQQEMDDIADDLLTASRDKAPQLTGEMIRTSKTDSKNARSQGRFSRRVKYTEEYAPIQHEGIYWSGGSSRSGAKSGELFRPGPVTAAKLGNRRGVGRHFLSKPFKKMEPKIPRQISKAVARAIRQSVR